MSIPLTQGEFSVLADTGFALQTRLAHWIQLINEADTSGASDAPTPLRESIQANNRKDPSPQKFPAIWFYEEGREKLFTAGCGVKVEKADLIIRLFTYSSKFATGRRGNRAETIEADSLLVLAKLKQAVQSCLLEQLPNKNGIIQLSLTDTEVDNPYDDSAVQVTELTYELEQYVHDSFNS